MPARPAFYVGHVSRGGHQIEQVDDIQRRRHPQGQMMQAGAAAMGERHVMHAAFEVHPCGP